MTNGLRGPPVVVALIVAMVLLILPIAARAEPPSAPRTTTRDLSRPIIVGVETDSFPYSFRDRDGAMKGFAIDVVSAVARTMGLSLEWHAAEVDAKLLQSGDVEMFPLMAETETRRRVADFSIPILTLDTVVVVRKGDQRIRHPSDLGGKLVAVGNPLSVGHDYIREQHPTATVDFTPTPLAMAMLAQGKFDAVVLSHLTANSEIHQQGLHTLEILPDRVRGYEVRRCVAVKRGDTLLLARINEGLTILHRTGEFERIHAQWMSRYGRTTPAWREWAPYFGGFLVLVALVVAGVLWRQHGLAVRVIRQDDELNEQRSLLAALFENQPLATWVLIVTPGKTPCLVSWNNQAAHLLGLAPNTLPGQPLDQLAVTAEVAPLIAEVILRCHQVLSGEPWETRLESSHRILESTMVPLGLSVTGANRICVLTGDVTLRRIADQDAAQSRRLQALGEMVGGIAHEFNNLLTPITATVGTMQQTCAEVEGLQDDLQLIDEATHRAAELTQRLLCFGRKTELRLKSVRVADVAANCLALVRPACDRRIEWSTKIPRDLPPLDFNPTDLNQILLNLLINARDALQQRLASSPGEDWIPRIEISVEELAPGARTPHQPNNHRELLGWQVMSVSDNGTGIPDSIKDRVFEPFFTTKDVGLGTGIGLATVWRMVTDAGGTITVNSEIGEGTAFHVVLPRWQRQTSLRPSGRPQRTADTRPRLRVFLAEDERLLARACIRGLTRLGHQVTHVVDGVDAWIAFENGAKDSHDVLVSDVNMPRMGGLDLIRKVRSAGFSGRVVVISGRVDSVNSEAITSLRIDALLAKPFNIEDLVVALDDGHTRSWSESAE